MANNTLRHILIKVLLSIPCFIFAQSDSTRLASQKEEVRSMVQFYQYLLNTIGSRDTPLREKEVIISQSYLKIFKDEQVQVEDDLIANRNAIINKDVTAYLRDVDFFFEHISFDFDSIKVSLETGPSDDYFLVEFISTISGVELDGLSTIEHQQKRFMEINSDPSSSELKIASIYSTKVSKEEELRLWWQGLSSDWKNVFKSTVPADTISTDVLLQFSKLDSLNLQGSPITDLSPLMALKKLRYLNVSSTQVSDINPLRFLKNLTVLDISNTVVRHLDILSYTRNIQKLNISGTRVRQIEPLQNLQLERLEMSGVEIADYTPLATQKTLIELNLSQSDFFDSNILSGLQNLLRLDLSQTNVTDTKVLQNLTSLELIDLSQTFVNDLSGFIDHPSIKTIKINNTGIASIEALKSAPRLTRVEGDFTNVSKSDAAALMKKRPGLMVITNSEEIATWWSELSTDWKMALAPDLENPSDEELIQLLNQDSLDISNHRLIDGSPLYMFNQIKWLDISRNLFTSLIFLSKLPEVETLYARNMPISSLTGIEELPLRKLVLSESLVDDISVLEKIKTLTFLDVDHTKVGEDQIKDLLDRNQALLIIYQSDELLLWWNNLSIKWQDIFQLKNPDHIDLHSLSQKRSLEIKNEDISDLSPLSVFAMLKDLTLERVQITNLINTALPPTIESLSIVNGPLSTLEGIESLSRLRALDISNTAVDDLKPLRPLNSLQHLNCAGTNIKRLKGLGSLEKLEFLNISNTRVWQLDRLYDIRALKRLECYNTRIRAHKIEAFKQRFPNCEITYY